MNPARPIAILLAVVLTTATLIPAEACDMASQDFGAPSAPAKSESSGCHDAAPEKAPQPPQDCTDCLDHCTMLAPLAMMHGQRIKVSDPTHSELPALMTATPAGMIGRLFKPPTTVSTHIS